MSRMTVEQFMLGIRTILDKHGCADIKLWTEKGYIEQDDWVIYCEEYALHETKVEQSTILETVMVDGYGIDVATYYGATYWEPEDVDIAEDEYTATSPYKAISDFTALVIEKQIGLLVENMEELNIVPEGKEEAYG